MTFSNEIAETPKYSKRQILKHAGIGLAALATVAVYQPASALTGHTYTKAGNQSMESIAYEAPTKGVESKIYLAQASQDEVKFEQLVREWGDSLNQKKWDKFLELYRKDATTVYDRDNKRGDMSTFSKYLNESQRVKRMPPVTVGNPTILNIEGDKARIQFGYKVGNDNMTATMDLVKEPDGRWLVKDYNEK